MADLFVLSHTPAKFLHGAGVDAGGFQVLLEQLWGEPTSSGGFCGMEGPAETKRSQSQTSVPLVLVIGGLFLAKVHLPEHTKTLPVSILWIWVL